MRVESERPARGTPLRHVCRGKLTIRKTANSRHLPPYHGVYDQRGNLFLAQLRVDHEVIKIRIFPVSAEVPLDIVRASSIGGLNQLSDFRWDIHPLRNATDARFPWGVNEDVKGLGTALQHALRSAADNNAIAFRGRIRNEFLGESGHSPSVRKLRVRGMCFHDQGGGPTAAPGDQVPPRID